MYPLSFMRKSRKSSPIRDLKFLSTLKMQIFFIKVQVKIYIFKAERNFKSRIGVDFRDFRIKLRGYMSFFEKFETFEIFRLFHHKGDQAKISKK